MIDCVVSRTKPTTNYIFKNENEHVKINMFNIYDNDNDSDYNSNNGNEAKVYLKYIIDNYDNLSDFTFFIRDNVCDWHLSKSIDLMLDEAVASGELFYNVNDRCIFGSILCNPCYNDILCWYNTFIEKYIPFNTLPNKDWTVGYRGSSQFLVHKTLIRKLPLEFYENLYNWTVNTILINDKSGRFLEWTWHIFWDIYAKL